MSVSIIYKKIKITFCAEKKIEFHTFENQIVEHICFIVSLQHCLYSNKKVQNYLPSCGFIQIQLSSLKQIHVAFQYFAPIVQYCQRQTLMYYVKVEFVGRIELWTRPFLSKVLNLHQNNIICEVLSKMSR